MVEKDGDSDAGDGPAIGRRGVLNAVAVSGLGLGGLAARSGSASEAGETTPGNPVVASETATSIDCGRTVDGVLTPDDEMGGIVAEDDDSGGDLDSRIDVQVDRPGRYLVVATSFSPGDTFEYNLTLQCL